MSFTLYPYKFELLKEIRCAKIFFFFFFFLRSDMPKILIKCLNINYI